MKEVHMKIPKSNLLRRTLSCNAIFSFVSGLIMLFATDYVVALLGDVPPVAISIIGAGLILFSAWEYYITRANSIPSTEVWGVIIGDLGWVIASIVLILVFSNIFTESGLWIIGGVAVVVFTFADLQFWGLRRSMAS